MSGVKQTVRGDFVESLRATIREIVREEIAAALAEQGEAGDFYSPTVAARVARVRPGTIRRWVRQGRIAAHYAGRAVRIKRDDLESFLRGDRRITSDLSPEQLAARDFG